MALQCQMSVNYTSYSAQQNAPPMATLFVYNPNAAAVNVSGVSLQIRTNNDTGVNHTAVAQVVVPVGTGMVTLVPATSSITIGPFPIVVGSAANANPFQTQSSVGFPNPVNAQGSQPPIFTIMVGATVSGSDGSSNEAGVAPIIVSSTSQPPVGYQGGSTNFLAPNNTNFVAVI